MIVQWSLAALVALVAVYCVAMVVLMLVFGLGLNGAIASLFVVMAVCTGFGAAVRAWSRRSR